MSTYEAGDVAMVTAYNRPTPYRAFFDGETWREYGAQFACVNSPTSISPLFVLDIADPAALVEYLKVATDGFDKAAHGMDAWAGRGPIREVWAQIETQVKAARIPEPGLWGVVEAAVETHGRTRGRFVRDTADTWACLDWPGDYGWTYLIDPILVRPGIEDES